jgi:hypothetical protein
VQAHAALVRRPPGQPPGHVAEGREQLVEAGALGRRHRHDGRARHELGGLSRGQLGLADVGLGDRHHAVLHPELPQHREVLARLRHHAVVRRHAQQEQVHARRAGHHRPHEALVSRHVHHRQPAAVRQRQRRVPELY